MNESVRIGMDMCMNGMGMCMNELVSLQVDASRKYHDPTQNQWCDQSLLPTKGKKNRHMGTYVKMSVKSRADV